VIPARADRDAPIGDAPGGGAAGLPRARWALGRTSVAISRCAGSRYPATLTGQMMGEPAMNDAADPWIDPELVAAGRLLQEKGLVAPDRTAVPMPEVRAAQDRIGAFLGEGSTPLEHERDLSLPGPGGQVPCRLYMPDGIERPPPLIVYAHGGAFVQGSLPSWDHFLRDLVRQSGAAALSVDYRLAPEHRFPAAFDDMAAITRLASHEGAGLGVDPTRLAVGGDSAGACLALGAALAMRDAGVKVRFQLLIYGCFSTDIDSPSWRRFGRAGGLTQASMGWAWQTYLQKPEHYRDWRAAPILAELKGVAPAHLIVGDLDPLLDDSNNLAEKLTAAGVPCQLTTYHGINHGFIRYGRLIGTARRAIADCAAALKAGLAAP
jgi:acetyl esterase